MLAVRIHYVYFPRTMARERKHRIGDRRRGAVGRKRDLFPVRRKRGAKIAAGSVGEIDRLIKRLCLARTKGQQKNLRVAVARANERDPLPIGRNRRLIFHRVTFDQEVRWLTSIGRHSEEIGRAASL